MAEKKFYTWKWVDEQIDKIGEQLEGSEIPQFVTGVPRGGLIPAVLISHKFSIPFIGLEAAKTLPGDLKKKILVIDDIADSGNTLAQIQRHNFKTATLARRYSSSFSPLLDDLLHMSVISMSFQNFDCVSSMGVLEHAR